jgi:hypothetical protein
MQDFFSHPSILGAMITPAVLISACASLILSTGNRLGRIFDRVNLLKIEVESILNGKLDYANERRTNIRTQLVVQNKRAKFIQISMKCLYSATCMFLLSSITSAIGAMVKSDLQWISILFASIGVILMLIASFVLFYETRFNLVFIEGQIEITKILESKINTMETKDESK